MALQQYGDNNYSFGFTDSDAAAIAAIIGLTPQEGTISIEPEVEAEGKDIFNRTVSFVVDDQGKKQFQLSGYISNNTLFKAAVGQTFTYEGLVYICKGREKTVKKDDFWMGSVTAINYPKITSNAKTQIAA
jgi:NADH:ubiquinone oxidoreductase subunit F (NADH-binding)